MKLLFVKNSDSIFLLFLSLAISAILFFNFSFCKKLKNTKFIINNKFLKSNEVILNDTLNSPNITQEIDDFPLKIEIIWNNIDDNLNLHLKRIQKGRFLNYTQIEKNFRINNETLIKSQIMMLEKLVSGEYILYAEKFDSLKSLNGSETSVSIYSESKSYFNITCDKIKINNLNWENPVFWEIGIFKFSSNSVSFEILNNLTNKLNYNQND